MSELLAKLEGLAIGLEQRGEKSAAQQVRWAAAEIERLRADADALAIGWNKASEDNERLRAALHETVQAIIHVQKHLIHRSPPQDAVMNGALATARRALEGK